MRTIIASIFCIIGYYTVPLRTAETALNRLLIFNKTLQQLAQSQPLEPDTTIIPAPTLPAALSTLSGWQTVYGTVDPNGDKKRAILSEELFISIINMIYTANYKLIEQTNKTTLLTTRGNLAADFLYLQKLRLSKASTIYCWGDLHGDIASLIAALVRLRDTGVIDDTYTILDKDTYIISCGDFVDRGNYGIECILLLSLLKLKNPNNVYMVRGNHEDIGLNQRYGFLEEYTTTFGKPSAKNTVAIQNLYGSLPCALYITYGDHNKYIQFCHGGLEMYDLEALLTTKDQRSLEIINKKAIRAPIKHRVHNSALYQQNILSISNNAAERTKLAQKIADELVIQDLYDQPMNEKLLNELCTKSISKATRIGFLWSDFQALGDTTITVYKNGRGLSYGKNYIELLTKPLIKSERSLAEYPEQTMLRYNPDAFEIIAIIRAHQHNSSMPQLVDQESNHSVYRLPYLTKPSIFTTVLTTEYVKNRGFVALSLASTDPETWTIKGIWQGKAVTSTWQETDWTPFTQWKNSVD